MRRPVRDENFDICHVAVVGSLILPAGFYHNMAVIPTAGPRPDAILGIFHSGAASKRAAFPSSHCREVRQWEEEEVDGCARSWQLSHRGN